ncbi:ATP-binding protein [Streptomyces tendae]|uniref:ATP-binding protein n=1 Tax=Streptomyces tendae TaxID=1932 RepID=A0A6B3QLL1_STRTE|nr:AAA family ATPase [Streptomyces tendae]NEV87807.1 ATP-binding protein [Streptomyces tendae]
MVSDESALVSAVEIRGLFGNKYLHVDLAGENRGHRGGRRLSLLYGNNGSGKTTVLKLLWHALSPSDRGGHRSEIAKTPFERFTIHLCSGDVISVEKIDGLVGDFRATVMSGDRRIVDQLYREIPEGKVIPVSPPLEPSSRGLHQKTLFDFEASLERAATEAAWREAIATAELSFRRSVHESERRPDSFVKYLKRLGTGPYMLADDRRIYGDSIDRIGQRRPRRHVEFEDNSDPQNGGGGVTAELAIALKRTHDMIQKMVINGNVSGSRGSNTVYLGILERVSLSGFADAEPVTRSDLINKLKEIADRTKECSTYGLMPRLKEDSFLDVLNETPDDQLRVADAVMQPFLEAQEARLDALSSVVKLLSTLTREVNRFFESSGKRASYTTQRGFRVTSDDGQNLQPESLSSGERQILLLLLNTVLARQSTPLFLIDEPELSLNVKWQRQLMGALLSLTEGASVQFVVATHSIEVITGHRDSLAKVAPRESED